MKKKYRFILLVLVCIGTFLPREVFAEYPFECGYGYDVEGERTFHYNTNINYKFKINDSVGNSINNLKFKLHDYSNTFSFESDFDDNSQSYYFVSNLSSSYENYNSSLFNQLASIEYGKCNYHGHDRDKFKEIVDSYPNLLLGQNGHSNYSSFYTAYSIIPFILEEISGAMDYKKIVLGTFHIVIHRHDDNDGIYLKMDTMYKYDISLINGIDSNISFSDNNYNDENVLFMRNAIYDYSDELWEELNSGPIASSEITFDNSDTDLTSPKLITLKTDDNKQIYSKYKSNVNYKFKVKNGNGMKLKLHDISNTFSFNSIYDKTSDTYSIVDNSTDNDYSEGIKEFSKIIIDEVKNGKFNELSTKYKSITSDNCSSTSCNITTYIPLILEGENNDEMAKQIVLGLMNIQYREESGNDYYDINLNVYNNTCDLLNSNIDLDMNKLINLSRAIEEDYSNDLMDKYSNGDISLEDISKSEDINNLKDKYCDDVPVISLRKIFNPKTRNGGIIVLIISMIVVIGSSFVMLKRSNVKE